MAGARRAQREIDKYEDAKLRVLVVWFEMYDGDERAAWRADLLNTSRASHYWDATKAVGRWYAARGGEFRQSGEILWDAWLLYETGARGTRALDKPTAWGRTIVATDTRLADALRHLATTPVR